jgi:hypothetical protein
MKAVKAIASGGTDAASMVLFWPDNLPYETDDELKKDPIAFVEELRDQGKLIWFPCDGDGGYTVAIYEAGQVPEYLKEYCKTEEHIPGVVVKGEGYFGGMEYIFKLDSSFRDKYPHMCGRVELPQGTYSARIYSTDVPETTYKSWLLKEAGVKGKRYADVHGGIAACAVAGVLVSFIAAFVATRTVLFCIGAVAIAFIGAAVAMSYTKQYKSVAQAKDGFKKAYPDYVVSLDRTLSGIV